MLIPAIPFLRRIVRPSTTWTSSASLAAASSTSWRSWWTTRRAAKNIPTTRWTNTVSSKLSISCLQNRKGCEKWLLYQLSHCHCPRWLNVTPIFWFPPISFLHFKSREFNYCLQARERERMMTSPVAAKDDKSLQKLSLLQSKKGDARCIFNVEAILSFRVSTSQTMICADTLSHSQSQLEL